MRILNSIFLQASIVACMGLASVAQARDCTDCDNGQRYCGEYSNGQWISGSWESCSGGLPPPPPSQPDCHNQAGHSELSRSYVSSTTCRPVRPGSNECIARGSATVSVDHLTCVYNNFDGCGAAIGTYEEECGSRYNSCGC